ncbi:CAP domain-containing protein [Aerococcus sanguinicola]|uniref:CAP domain-containing protein n=4 Tax=Aerococcus TaxID=1375 RepID=A0A2I1MQ29_9LACT|nr:CAP domain-containing protein [Aerococcus sanguinicola]MDK7050148.1 CAP domain-containing protein [Aerococcus sanguinicola]PKZ22248.1 CAP domain-containing protein [Aerococcus sanguinicola]
MTEKKGNDHMKLDKKLLIALGLIGAGSLGLGETVQADDFDDDYDDYEDYEVDDDWDDYDTYDDDYDGYDDDWDDYDAYTDSYDYDGYDDIYDDYDDDIYDDDLSVDDYDDIHDDFDDDDQDEDLGDDDYDDIHDDFDDDDQDDNLDDNDYDDIHDGYDDDQDDDLDDDDYDDIHDDFDDKQDKAKESRPIPVAEVTSLASEKTVDLSKAQPDFNLIPRAEASTQETATTDTKQDPTTVTTPSADAVTLANQSTTSLSQAISKHFHDLVNQERTQQGLAPLAYQDSYQAAANNRTQEIIDCFSHTRPNGQAFHTANGFESAGSYVGENIQQTYASPGTSAEAIAQELFNNWKNSPGHYANMIDANYKGQSLGLEFIQNGDHTLIYSAQILGQ